MSATANEPGNVLVLPGGLTPVELLNQMVRAASGEVDVIESDLPMPPNGASARAQAFWTAVLREHGDLGIARMQLLEAIVDAISQYDSTKADWERDGCPTTTTGSTGQNVEDNRLTTMTRLRTQEAALLKQLDLASGDAPRRRPGRPTRAESHAKGNASSWGTR